jgi:exodeoxyribonuclease VII small subunit
LTKKKQVNFEEGLERLQEIVEQLELGTATLDETLRLYEEGIRLATALNAELAEAETRVEELSAGLADSQSPDSESPGEGPESAEDNELF